MGNNFEDSDLFAMCAKMDQNKLTEIMAFFYSEDYDILPNRKQWLALWSKPIKEVSVDAVSDILEDRGNKIEATQKLTIPDYEIAKSTLKLKNRNFEKFFKSNGIQYTPVSVENDDFSRYFDIFGQYIIKLKEHIDINGRESIIDVNLVPSIEELGYIVKYIRSPN